MFVGVCRLVLQIPGTRSLKEKRRVVKSFKDRASGRLPIALAEVGDANLHQVATLGAAVVSSDAAICQSAMARLVDLARHTAGAVLADVSTEVLSFGSGGAGLGRGVEQWLEPDFAGGTLHEDPDGDAAADTDESAWPARSLSGRAARGKAGP